MPFPKLTERCKERTNFIKLTSTCTSKHTHPHLPISPIIIINSIFKVSKAGEKRKEIRKTGFFQGLEDFNDEMIIFPLDRVAESMKFLPKQTVSFSCAEQTSLP